MTAGRKSSGAKNFSYGRSYREEDRHLIENYSEAVKTNFRGWILIHRLEYDENWNRIRTKAELIAENLYYARPASELKYITMKDFFKLNPVSQKMKEHLSAQKSGKNNYWYGKSLQESTKKKISAKKRLPGLELSYRSYPTKERALEYLKSLNLAYPRYSKFIDTMINGLITG